MGKYIALLRGINIMGKNKIAMEELKHQFEQIGYSNVVTYLNSGNVIFTSAETSKDCISNNIQSMIEDKFQLTIFVYVIKSDELIELLDNQPSWWGSNNKEIYDNIIFVIPPHTSEQVYDELGAPHEELERTQPYKNNIFWSFNLANYQKTNWWQKTASLPISKSITIRTSNTMRKILEICNR